MAGIRDVAREAHVGIGTVSRYLNGSGYVSEESRNRIETAIKTLDYQPMNWREISTGIDRGS